MDLPIKDACLFENVAQIDVCIQKVWIQCDCFFKMMNCQPNFTLSVEHATQIAPCNGKIGTCFNSFQITRLNIMIDFFFVLILFKKKCFRSNLNNLLNNFDFVVNDGKKRRKEKCTLEKNPNFCKNVALKK